MSQVAISNTPELAYEHAYARHWADVFRFALAWTNDWAQAEDLAQDAFLRLWDHRTRIDWDRPVLPWLLVTTRRLATDRFRRLRRRLMAEPVPATLESATQDRWLDVRDAMKALTPVERASLVLTAVEGATYEEAAAALGTTAGALRAAASRARTKLEEVA